MKDLIRPYCNGNNNSEKLILDWAKETQLI